MEVVGGIQVHILYVPGESGRPHSKIQVRVVDPRYDIRLVRNTLQNTMYFYIREKLFIIRCEK